MQFLMMKQFIKRILNRAGFDVVRISRKPEHTLVGLRSFPFRTIIDVGANTGQFARKIMSIFPQAQIYSFEPLPEPFRILQGWAVQQLDERVVAFNVALGDDEGMFEMFKHLDHSPSSSFLRSTGVCEGYYPFIKQQASVSVDMRTLDGFLVDKSISLLPPILIKLDVQGFEDRVIKGGRRTFERSDACIVEIGLDPLYEGQAYFTDVTTLLKELGYKYAGNLQQKYVEGGQVAYVDAVFTKRAG